MHIQESHFNELVAHEMHLGYSYEQSCELLEDTLLGQIARLADALDYALKTLNDVLKYTK